MQIDNNNQTNKLAILYILDQMATPLKENVLSSMVLDNNWMNLIDFRTALSEMLNAGLVINMTPNNSEPRYGITLPGREGLDNFYSSIPISLRQEIAEHIKKNRLIYRKKQEYIADYYKNKDGTYTVTMKIESSSCTLMDLKIVVQSRSTAKRIYNTWAEKASIIYEHIYDNLIE